MMCHGAPSHNSGDAVLISPAEVSRSSMTVSGMGREVNQPRLGTALVHPGSGKHRQNNRRAKALRVQVASNSSLAGLQKFADS
jgi:hypothetical protein